MKDQRLYIKHQAFSAAYKEGLIDSSIKYPSHEAAKLYHHAPDKLDNNGIYLNWFSKLFVATQRIILELNVIYNEIKLCNSSFFCSTKKIHRILNKLDDMESDLKELRNDIIEFENCIIVSDLILDFNCVQAISGQKLYIDSLESRIIETCNRKLSEISSSRISLSALVVAVLALVISFIK